jgi:hypothetical protein
MSGSSVRFGIMTEVAMAVFSGKGIVVTWARARTRGYRRRGRGVRGVWRGIGMCIHVYLAILTSRCSVRLANRGLETRVRSRRKPAYAARWARMLPRDPCTMREAWARLMTRLKCRAQSKRVMGQVECPYMQCCSYGKWCAWTQKKRACWHQERSGGEV